MFEQYFGSYNGVPDFCGAFVVDCGTGALSRDVADYPGGVVIPIDKPYRWTSADVIRKVKFAAFRHFGKRNLKVGHAGTLDPLATGILIVCIGKATKMAQTLQDHDKEYIAGVTFGATTPSYDLEKDIDRKFPYGHITEGLIRERLREFIGEQRQVAPLFSAKSVDGVRAYELARKLFRAQQRGELAAGAYDSGAVDLLHTAKIRIIEAELLTFSPFGNTVIADRNLNANRSTRDITEITHDAQAVNDTTERSRNARTPSGRISVADTSALRLPRADIRIVCSKGTYIRAFARDLGESLGSGAHLDSLRRTKNGPFDISRALTLDRVLSLLT